MRCDQIDRYLADYAAGELPAYKASWVAQHLAGCEACQTAVAEVCRQRLSSREQLPPDQPEGSAVLAGEGSASVAVQRPVPVAVRAVVSIGLVLLVAGSVWAALREMSAPASRPESAEVVTPGDLHFGVRPGTHPDEVDHSVRFQAGMQSQGGVSLWLESVSEANGEVRVRLRFHGDDLFPPPGTDGWVQILDAEGMPLPSSVNVVTVDAEGVAAELDFRLPDGQDRFRVWFAGVNQVAPVRWSLALPDPPDQLEHPDQPITGAPGGVQLHSYGQLGDLLHIEIQAASWNGRPIPRLYLRDAKGVEFAPSLEKGSYSEGVKILQYPLPKDLHLPVRLVGDGYSRKYLGPWTIEVNVLK